MRLGGRIALGYGALIALMSLVLFYQVTQVQRMYSLSKRLVEASYEAGTGAVQLQNDLYRVDNVSRKFLQLDSGPDYVPALPPLLRDITAKIDRLSKLDLSSQEIDEFEILRRRWQRWNTSLEPLLDTPNRSIAEAVQADLLADLDALIDQVRKIIVLTRQGSEDRIAEARSANEQAQLVAWVSGILAVALGIAIAVLTVRSIVGPVDRLRNATRRLAHGDFSSRVEATGTDEFSQLAQHFNVMVRRLEELDQLKRDLVSQVSHDLKAPMASIQETTALLMEEIPGPINSKQERLLRLNLNCSQRLSDMINKLLDLSKLESGAPEYDFQSVDLRASIESMTAELEPLLREKNCEIRLDSSVATLPVTCDSGRILQVTRNLLDNALNFSPRDSVITVAVDPLGDVNEVPGRIREKVGSGWAGDFARVRISDCGPGVPPDQIERIFEKFHQAKDAALQKGQGVGLGLAICRTIVDAHGGAIWVENGVEPGATFTYLLPVKGPDQVRPFSPKFASVVR